MPRKRAGTDLTMQLRRLKRPAKVMLVTTTDVNDPQPMISDVNLAVYTREEIQEMDERDFMTLTGRHDCILLTPQLGDGDLFLRSLREALNNQLGGTGARLILHEIEATTPDPHINQRQLWENLQKTLGEGSDQLREATMRRLRLALDEENTVN
ncbi:MAG: hypothetical protein NTV61_11015 [Candidatus Bathyarchaeota archaeon]|nr:hypothetical protein [Candidatus Bathyarchaeota archaeon]